MKPHIAYVPRPSAASAAAVISSASATELASGFSQSTCLPAASAARAMSRWVLPGVQMSTRSTSSRSTTARQSVADSAQPNCSAACAARPASRPTTTCITGRSGRSKKRWALRHACEWAAPMKAWPIIATRSGAVADPEDDAVVEVIVELLSCSCGRVVGDRLRAAASARPEVDLTRERRGTGTSAAALVPAPSLVPAEDPSLPAAWFC